MLKQRRRMLRHNQTKAEEALWRRVRNRQFHGIRFFRQYSIGPYIVDFYCPALKLAIELDGGQHTQDENREYDAGRTEYLEARDIRVMRFWNHEVLGNIDSVMSILEKKVNPS